MKKLLVLLSAGLLALSVSAQSLTSRSLTASATRDVGLISQSIDINGAQSFEVSVAPLTLSNQGFGTRKLSIRSAGTPFKLPDPVAIPRGGVTTAKALKEAGFWVQVEYGPFKDQVTSWLRSRGLSQTYFTYNQEVNIASAAGPRTMRLSFLSIIDASGRSTHGVVKLVDKAPLLLEARYTPLRAAEGLPADWKYDNAGLLEWRLMDPKDYKPATSWVAVDVGGAYDNPDEGDPLAMVPCLVDSRNPGCPAGVPSVKDLMEENAASFGLVNYIRRIEPSYEVNDKDEQIPKGIIEVTDRKWACNVLNHKGVFGMEVLTQADTFVVQTAEPVYTFQKVSEAGELRTANPTYYNVSVPSVQLAGNGPEQVMLAPLQDTNLANNWWLLTDFEKMKSVNPNPLPPLVVDASAAIPLSFSLSPDLILHETYGAGDIRDYIIGTPTMEHWSSKVFETTDYEGNTTGTYSAAQYDNDIVFNLDDVRSVQEFLLTQVTYDDWLRVAVNGTIVFIGPRGGNTLELAQDVIHNGQQACQRQGSGYACGTRYCSVDIGGCVFNPTHYYPACYLDRAEVGEFKGRPIYNYFWKCQPSSCPAGTVQTLIGSTGLGAGCWDPTTGTQQDQMPLLDIKPYLRTGQNVIQVRAIVGPSGGGAFFLRPADKAGALLRFRTQICNPPS